VRKLHTVFRKVERMQPERKKSLFYRKETFPSGFYNSPGMVLRGFSPSLHYKYRHHHHHTIKIQVQEGKREKEETNRNALAVTRKKHTA